MLVIPDVLFCFYNHFDVCAHRLCSLRRLNRRVRVYGLYGGPLSQQEEAKSYLVPWLDDFYSFPEERDSKWKWINFDCIIARWYRDRGRKLEWETVFIQQWDMLVIAPLQTLFPNLRPGEIFLSGYRPVKEIDDWWPWVKREKAIGKQEYEAFKEYIAETFGYRGEVLACLFIVACLPREFLDCYARRGPPEIGFLEYRLPTMAKIFGTAVCQDDRHRPWWASDPATQHAPAQERTLNAVGAVVPLSVVVGEASSRTGKRIFHPVLRDIADWQLKPFNARWLSLLWYLGRRTGLPRFRPTRQE